MSETVTTIIPPGWEGEWLSVEQAPESADFRVANPCLGNGAKLRELFQTDGYLFVKGCIPTSEIQLIHGRVRHALHKANWLESAEDRVPVPGMTTTIGEDAFWPGLEAILRVPEVCRLTESAGLRAVLSDLFGEPVLCHPRRIPRAVFPSNPWGEVPAHQDLPYMQGTFDQVTVWIPFHDCPRAAGPLEVLAGSHLEGMREMYGGGRFRCAATRVDAADPRWRGGDYAAGDALLFSSLTVHRARQNHSGRVRLSMDSRFQPVNSPMCEHVLEPPFHPNVAEWPQLLPDDPELYQVPDGTRIEKFVEPNSYRPTGAARVFPWIKP